jgi:hypothetical protein
MININELGEKKRHRDKVRLTTYKTILLKCHHKIKRMDDKTDTNMFFNIPEYLFGYPKYNILECHDYLKKKLTGNGFIVYDINPYKLFISWDHVSHTKKYISYPQPKKEKDTFFKKSPKKLYSEQTIQYRDINDQINTNDLFT